MGKFLLRAARGSLPSSPKGTRCRSHHLIAKKGIDHVQRQFFTSVFLIDLHPVQQKEAPSASSRRAAIEQRLSERAVGLAKHTANFLHFLAVIVAFSVEVAARALVSVYHIAPQSAHLGAVDKDSAVDPPCGPHF